ncbi:hypothetical protein VTL71DRAFT_16565 [Oculimacula yallundae]|uniref:Uncharacterized protein n=1 Tax=Oculimacula yallundae TaxID=86028 RepID=A0ABR4CES9_9HELO
MATTNTALHLSKATDMLLNSNLFTYKPPLNKHLPRKTVAVSSDVWRRCAVVGCVQRLATPVWNACVAAAIREHAIGIWRNCYSGLA